MDEGRENIPGRVNYLQLDCIRFEAGNSARLSCSATVRAQRWIWDLVMGLTESQWKYLLREAYYDLHSESSWEGCGGSRFKSRLEGEREHTGLVTEPRWENQQRAVIQIQSTQPGKGRNEFSLGRPGKTSGRWDLTVLKLQRHKQRDVETPWR